MWINIYVGIFASVAVFAAATPHHVGYLDYPYTTYQEGFLPGASIQSPLSYSTPNFYDIPYDFTGASGIPNYFYPGLEYPAVAKVAGTKDKNAAGKKVDTKIKTKDLCETIQDAFGKPGVQHFYSLDNGPLFIKNGFDFNYVPSFGSWPFGNDYFGVGGLGPLGAVDTKPTKVPVDQLKKGDDDTVAIERKITVKVPGSGSQANVPDTTVGIINPFDTTESVASPNVPDAANDAANDGGDDGTITIPPLPSSSEAPTSSSANPQADDESDNAAGDESAKRKRQSKVRGGRRL